MTGATELRPQLAAAAEWRLLALLLSRPREGWAHQISAMACEVPDDLRTAAARAALASEGAYHALLGPGGAASPREAAHAGFVDPGRILADLTERYEAFAFRPSSEEPADHLAVECDFVSYLFLKEAYALAGGAAGAAEIARDARARFIEEHVAVAGHGLARKMPPHAPEYLARAALALSARLPEPPPAPTAAGDDDPLEGGCPASCTIDCTR
jgi:nitrate reductase assembly molybdenum cofactor insertion protein NarJ